MDKFESMALALEANNNYRVLRRLRPQVLAVRPDCERTRIGLFLDLETTGLDPVCDEIIEFGMVPFVYTLEGQILGSLTPFSKLRMPALPISSEITALTGITSSMVAGQKITTDEVADFVGDAALVIAHNARFDRPFAERFWSGFAGKPWACSMTDIPWTKEGFEGRKLGYLALQAGWFFDAHRAVDDCQAGIALLAAPLPFSQRQAFSVLLENARVPHWRIWAENASYDTKDLLKARGYRWNDGADDRPRAWFVDVPTAQKEAELNFLKAEIYRHEINLLVREISPWDRFSERD